MAQKKKKKSPHSRRDSRTRTVTTFKKTYGNRIYHFTHEVTDIEGFVSASTYVRVKRKDDGPLAVGKLAHGFLWFKDDPDEEGND